jgi:hypothetical protein
MESDTQPLAANHFAIRVDDIDAAVTDLQELGVEVQKLFPGNPGQLGAGLCDRVPEDLLLYAHP